MIYEKIIGISASVLSTISFLPQVLLVYRKKSSKDISGTSFSVFMLGGILWFIYGCLKNDIPIIFTNGFIVFLSFLILLSKILYKGNNE